MSDATNYRPSKTKETVPADVALDAVVERLGQLRLELEAEFERCREISAENWRLREALPVAIAALEALEEDPCVPREIIESHSVAEDLKFLRGALNATGGRDE